MRSGIKPGEYSLWLAFGFGLMSGLFTFYAFKSWFGFIVIFLSWGLYFSLVWGRGFGYAFISLVLFGGITWFIAAMITFFFDLKHWPMVFPLIAFLTIPSLIVTLYVWKGRPTERKANTLRSGAFHPVFLVGLGVLGGMLQSEGPNGFGIYNLMMIITMGLAFYMVRKYHYLTGTACWWLCLICFLTTEALFLPEYALWTEAQITTLKPGLTLLVAWIVGAMFLARALDRETQRLIFTDSLITKVEGNAREHYFDHTRFDRAYEA